LRDAGLDTPVVAAGKIGTVALAEKILADGDGDLIGMARALLADPDLPNKWKSGNEDRVVRCVYGNVCKSLDENFRRVDCTLWPKKLGQAPESNDEIAPKWAETGSRIRAEYKGGAVLVTWDRATDNEAIYGYQLFRAESDSVLLHHASVRGVSTRYEDARVLGGAKYRYAVRPYDLAGNRGPMSPTIAIDIPN
jgi:dimethylglycine catabolism A